MPSSARTSTPSTQSNSALTKCQPCARLVPGDVKMTRRGLCFRGPGMPIGTIIRGVNAPKRRIKSLAVERISWGYSTGGRKRRTESVSIHAVRLRVLESS